MTKKELEQLPAATLLKSLQCRVTRSFETDPVPPNIHGYEILEALKSMQVAGKLTPDEQKEFEEGLEEVRIARERAFPLMRKETHALIDEIRASLESGDIMPPKHVYEMHRRKKEGLLNVDELELLQQFENQEKTNREALPSKEKNIETVKRIMEDFVGNSRAKK